MARAEARPAFYALRAGGWRDYVTLLHAPYTAWHLSYVAIGAALAASFDLGRLAAALAAFFLAVGIAAHCLDELRGRPLGTQVPRGVLIGLAAASLAGAVVLGIAGAARVGAAFLIVVAVGVVLVLGYNLELFGGRLHSDLVFACAWGAFPVLASAYAQHGGLNLAVPLGAAFAFTTSLAQRHLSSWARGLRRRALRIEGAIDWRSGERSEVDAALLAAPAESALRWLALAHVLLAVALVALRLSLAH